MCDMCRMTPCHPRCPNAQEPKKEYECCICGYGLFKGDKYLYGLEGYVCKECLDDMTSGELLEMLGESLETA